MHIAIPISLIVLASVGTLAHTRQQEEGDPGTEWEAPEDAKAKPNPLPSTAEVLAEGSALYKKNCEMCHGVTGKGDGPATQFVKPAPHDISTPEVQSEMTDGSIFWKLTVGKKPMPPFGKKLSDNERWALVHYVRGLKVD